MYSPGKISHLSNVLLGRPLEDLRGLCSQPQHLRPGHVLLGFHLLHTRSLPVCFYIGHAISDSLHLRLSGWRISEGFALNLSIWGLGTHSFDSTSCTPTLHHLLLQRLILAPCTISDMQVQGSYRGLCPQSQHLRPRNVLLGSHILHHKLPQIMQCNLCSVSAAFRSIKVCT